MIKQVTLTNLHNGRKTKANVMTDDDECAIIGSGGSNFESSDVTTLSKLQGWYIAFMNKAGLVDDVAFFSGLSKCIERNLGIVKGIYLQANRVKSPRYKGAIGEITKSLRMGEKLSASMAKQKELFSTDVIALIEAGEEAGQLGEVCTRIAINKKKSSKIAKKLKSGMAYPVVVTILGLGVVILMSVTLVPSMAKLYSEMGSTLPAATRMLMKFSDFLKYQWYYLSIPIAMVYMLIQNWGKICQMQGMQSFFLKLPVVGKIVRKNALAISFRVFAMLIEANVRMTNALQISAKGAPHWHVSTFFNNVYNHIQEGVSLSESFLHEAHWLGEEGRNICGLMEVAAETGSGTELLNEIAEDFEEDLDNIANQIDKVLEPLTMVILGGIVGFLIYAIYSPVFNMGGALLK